MSEEANQDQTPENQIPEGEIPQDQASGQDIGNDEELFPGGESQTLADEVARLTAELDEMREALLRQRAETENVRRRGEREKADAGTYAVTSFARDVLSVADNIRRALDSVPENHDESVKVIVEGVELTERELLATLERHGITRVNPEIGEAFDPSRHQALFEVPTEEQPNGTISQIIGAGYVIKDRLLRPAMVGVAKNTASQSGVDTKA